MIATPFDASRRVFGGCDLSSTTDLSSFAMVQRRQDRGWNANWLYWIPEETLEAAERRDHVPYQQWREAGWLRTCHGRTIDHQQVRHDVLEQCVAWDIGQVGYDPWNTQWLQAQLEEEGIEAIKVSQGMSSLSEPSKHLQAAVAEGTFKHGRNPIARWMAENVEVYEDTNRNIRPVKPASNKRIDGIVAAVMAIAVAVLYPEEEATASQYDEPGGLWL